MGNAALARLTNEEYLSLEENADTKHEYWNGVIVAMAGCTLMHSAISNAASFVLTGKLKGRKCTVFNSEAKVYVEHFNHYLYPDLSIACEGEQKIDFKSSILLDPSMIVEVLSPSTMRKDLGSKLLAYKSISGLKYILIIYQDTLLASLYTRQDSNWESVNYFAKEQVIQLEGLGIEVALGELYGELINEAPFNEPPDTMGDAADHTNISN